MILHRELFECVPFDPLVTRGEDRKKQETFENLSKLDIF